MTSSFNLCKYRNALGVPGKGVHSVRFGGVAGGGVAVVDVLLTIVGAYIIARWARVSFAWTAAGLFLLGIILHRLFCVRTTIDRLLFPSGKRVRFAWVLLFEFIYLIYYYLLNFSRFHEFGKGKVLCPCAHVAPCCSFGIQLLHYWNIHSERNYMYACIYIYIYANLILVYPKHRISRV